MSRVFSIADKFTLPKKGVVFTGEPFPEAENCRLAEGAIISVRTDGKEVLSAPMLGFELMRNTWSPHKPRTMAVLIGEEFAAHVIPERAEVWVADASVLPPENKTPNQSLQPTGLLARG
jgi:hypothetical protein